MNTVNVIEINNDFQVQQLKAFPDTPEGNQAAETLFRKIAKENTDFNDAQIDFCIEEGTLNLGNWAILIVHST